MTALSFAVFGIGSLIMGLLLVPYFWLTIRSVAERARELRYCTGRGMRFFVWVLKSSGVLDCTIRGQEYMQTNANVLVLANHPSLIDVVFLLALFPQSQCVVKKAIWANPFTACLIGNAKYISNADPELMLRDAEAALAGGESLILFPEGTRTEPGREPVFKLGAAAVAVRSGKDIQPVLLNVSPTTLTKSDKWYSVPESKVLMSIEIFPAMETSGLFDQELDQRHRTRMLNANLQDWFCGKLSV